jgi:antitoxin PrlF
MSSQTDSCGCSPKPDSNTANLFAVTKIDERGQVVIPKEIRDGMGWNKSEKIAIITRTNAEGKPCCLMLVHVDSLSSSIKGFINTLK